MADQSKDPEGKIFIHYDESKKTVKVNVEKRLLARIPVGRDLCVRFEGGDHLAQLVNISGGGALVRTSSGFRPGQIIEICIDEKSLPFARAEILRVERKGFSYGMRWTEIFEDQLPRGLITRLKT